MNLCVTSYKAVWRSAQAAGGWATDGGFPFQMQAISSLFDRTELVVCERPAPAAGPSTPLPSCGVQVVPLPEPGTRRSRVGRDGGRKLFLAGTAGYYLSRLAVHVARADAVHAVVPGDIGMLGMVLALAMRKRLFVRYCSSWPDTAQTSRANRLCKRLMVRYAGGRRVMLATGLGEIPPDGPGGRMRWIFSTSLRAADLEMLGRVAAARAAVPGVCRLLYVGRLSPEKGLFHLLDALARLVSCRQPRGGDGATGREGERGTGRGGEYRHRSPRPPLAPSPRPPVAPSPPRPCWQLALAGSGPQHGALCERAAALGLEGHVRFTGPLDRAGVLHELAAADLFVLPSLTEGFPKVLVEAMAAGLPVVASSVGAIPAILGTDGAHGLLISPGQDDALAGALAALAADPVRCRAMGQSARRRAQAWALEAWAQQIGTLLEEAWGVPLRSGTRDEG